MMVSLNGEDFHLIGATFAVTPGTWIGAKIGIFVGGQTAHGEFGYADFDWFRIRSIQ
jgi:hypothetical protein